MHKRNVAILLALALLSSTPSPAELAATCTAVPLAGAPAALSVMTYNVKGLPWPVARGRDEDLLAIGDRLANLRVLGRQPHVVALQEAFTDQAREIGRRGGYAHIVAGPSADEAQAAGPITAEDRTLAAGARWVNGEGAGKYSGSGLQIASDYPVVRVARAAFPAFACAGYDCLANKGILLVALAVPGVARPVEIVTTHMNSRNHTGVSRARGLSAYRRQVAFLARFLVKYHDQRSPIIMAGDFNTGPAGPRRQALGLALRHWRDQDSAGPLREPLAVSNDTLLTGGGTIDAAHWIIERGSDRQFAGDGSDLSLTAGRLTVPFGRDCNGKMLSDHMGFAFAYQITPRMAKPRGSLVVAQSVSRAATLPL